MTKSKLSAASGKHRRYACQCEKVVSVTLPLLPGKGRCGNCNEYLAGQPYTVEDLSVRRRDEAGAK